MNDKSWGQQPVTRHSNWDRTSPMWWHRSPGHRTFCIVGAGLLAFAGFWAQMVIFAIFVVGISS